MNIKNIEYGQFADYDNITDPPKIGMWVWAFSPTIPIDELLCTFQTYNGVKY